MVTDVASHVPALVVTIAATPSELSDLRLEVTEFCRVNGGSDDLVDDLELIVSELATNVMRHTRDTDLTLTLRADAIDRHDARSVGATRLARRWVMQMTGATEIPDIDDIDTPPVDQEGGRGLIVVRAVADDIEFDRAGGTVTCTLAG